MADHKRNLRSRGHLRRFWTCALLVPAILLGGCGKAGKSPVASTPPSADQIKVETLAKYAPRVYLAADGLQGGGKYWPSSVEWAMAYMKYARINDGVERHWVITIDPLASPTSTLAYFQGPGDLAGVPTYAFWIEDPSRPRDWVDLVYFFFYPYNRGKDAFGSVWGNHVGDWEHITVRLTKQTLAPQQVALSAHAGGETVAWSVIEKTSDGHPIVYSAWGSHANYSQPGDHNYHTIDVPGWVPYPDVQLIDRCSPSATGTAWDTWRSVVAFDFYASKALGSTPWPGWMRTDFDNPASAAIWRWGNQQWQCEICFGPLGCYSPGECLLNDGPTGPVSKSGVWDVDLFE